MPIKLKVLALGLLVLSALLILFFEASKHNPILSAACPFAEDPYDAVGSFAVQLVPLTALLACVRAFRPYDNGADATEREVLAGTAYIGFCAVGVTALSDGVALARYPSRWLAAAESRPLAVYTTALVLASMAGIVLLQPFLRRNSRDYLRALVILPPAFYALACWPPLLHRGMWGSLFTAFAGSAIFFLMTWSLAPASAPLNADALDDVAALLSPLQHAFAYPNQRLLREHPFGVALLTGGLIGFVLVALELRGEAGSIPLARWTLVVPAYVGLEAGEVAVGYALLSAPLGLFRRLNPG